jgi:chromosome segregation ATPase
VTRRLDHAQHELADLEQAISEMEGDAKEIRARLDGLGHTFAAGVLISGELDSLPSVAEHQRNVDRRRVSINETQLRIVSLASELRRLERDLPGESALVVSRLPGLPAANRDEAVAVVGRLLEARRKIARPLLQDLDKLLNSLVETQAREQDLLDEVQDLGGYLRSRASWVRNGRRVTLADVPPHSARSARCRLRVEVAPDRSRLRAANDRIGP